MNPEKFIPTEFVVDNKRVVSFKETEKGKESENTCIKVISYVDYIKQEAERRGLVEKMGQMVDAHTKKVDRGQVCEEALLGRCVIGKNEKIPVPIDRKSGTYSRAKNIIFDFAKTHQPREKEKNEQNVSAEVEAMIKGKLMDKNLDFKTVKFYTAVGTPLDYQYGIDGWVEIVDSYSRKEVITFDLKTGAYNNPSVGADILLKLDIKEDGFTAKETLGELFNFTSKIVEAYQERSNLR